MQPLSSSEVMDLKYKGGIATLTIKEVFPEDEGTYVCTATNSIGSVTTTCKLTINRKYSDKKIFLHNLILKKIFKKDLKKQCILKFYSKLHSNGSCRGGET